MKHRILRQALANHFIIILISMGLIYELTDILWIILYYNFHFTLVETPSFALIWTYIDYRFSTIQLMLFAWRTIERHILIFYSKCVSTKKKRSFVDYLPIISILIYSLGYYLIIFYATTSMNTFFYTTILWYEWWFYIQESNNYQIGLNN